jgi:hypothetical protein
VHVAGTGQLRVDAAANLMPPELSHLVYHTGGLTIQSIIRDHLLHFAVSCEQGHGGRVMPTVVQLPLPWPPRPACPDWNPDRRGGCKRSANCDLRHMT